MRFRLERRLTEWLLDIGVICVVGLSIAAIVGFLQDRTPFGDDSIYFVGTLKTLSSSWPFLAWDPHDFAGYAPTIGLSWLTFVGPFALVKAGLDEILSFHIAFVGVFLLFGLSLYFFARAVGSGRIFSVLLPVLGWSTNAYWNIAIWGAAYNRAFTVPFMIFALGTTYRFVSQANSGRLGRRDYWLCLGAWTLTYLGDVFIAIAGTAVGLIFLLVSAGRDDIISGLKRVGLVILPAAGLVMWKVIPVLIQSIAVAPYRNQYTGPNDWTVLLVPGSKWASTLNFVLVPLILVLSAVCLLTRVRTSSTEGAFLASLFGVSTYWLVMGWVPLLWPYLPRLMSTTSSIENLAWIFLMALPILYAVLNTQLATTTRIPIPPRFHMPVSFDTRRLVNLLRTVTLLLIVANALIVIPTIKPVNWTPLYDQLDSALNVTLGAPSSDFRVSLENRALTRTSLYYQPDRLFTGGRVDALDPNPFFDSWYLTDVFYKNDLGSMNANYLEDRPQANVSSLLESPYNFAGEKFWLDWYGVNGVAFYPYSYLYNTLGNYSIRSSLFSVTERQTSYLSEFFVRPSSPSPILAATNATLVGFYSTSGNSENEYQSLISMLSSMGLSSRFVIPLYLHSIQDALNLHVDLLVTDSYTYSSSVPEFASLFKTSNLAVVSSSDSQLGSAPTVQPIGSHLLVNFPLSFSQLVSESETGGLYFWRSASPIGLNYFNASSSAYYGAKILPVAPNSWTSMAATSNVQGTLQTSSNSVTLNITSTDSTRRSQFNIDTLLPYLVPLTTGLTVSFSVQTSANVTLGVGLSSANGCCPNYIATDEKVGGANSIQFQIPYSEFKKWGNTSDMFGVSRDLAFAVNLPTGQLSVLVRISNISLAIPSYIISDIPKPVAPSYDGLLQYNTLGANGVGLLNKYNASTIILNLSGSTQNSTTTLASFSGGENDTRYDKIIIVGGVGQPTPMVVLFTQSPWSPVHETWSNNENMIASSVPQGFRGIVWKETYSSQWKFQSGPGNMMGTLSYYYAGPGMIYIPLSNNMRQLTASFSSTTITSIGALSASIVTVASLVLLRNRLPKLSIRREASKRS